MTALLKTRWILLGLTLFVVFSAGPAFAVDILQFFTFDENGHGSETINGGLPISIPGLIAVDPGIGIQTLFYPVPGLLTPIPLNQGFVEFLGEAAGNIVSDVVHFVSQGPSGSGVFFYF